MTPQEGRSVPPSDRPRIGGLLIPVAGESWNARPHYRLSAAMTIGRASGCGVHVNKATVSRIHAELHWTNSGLVITHLSQSSPTFVNGVPMTAQQLLANGDTIEIGEGVVFRVELFSDGDDSTVRGITEVRRMFAVLHADVVGYSRLIERDVLATARRLDERLATMKALVARASGRFQMQGDELLALFSSAAAAVRTGLAWQGAVAGMNAALAPEERLSFRVGVNSGDLLITGAGLAYGETINIAARIQALAGVGEVFVSGAVRDQLRGQPDLAFGFVGAAALKNVSYEVAVWRAALAGC